MRCTLTRAADDHARDLIALVATLVALVEPAVLLLMGDIVMLLVMSILLPIVNFNNLVNRRNSACRNVDFRFDKVAAA